MKVGRDKAMKATRLSFVGGKQKKSSVVSHGTRTGRCPSINICQVNLRIEADLREVVFTRMYG